MESVRSFPIKFVLRSTHNLVQKNSFLIQLPTLSVHKEYYFFFLANSYIPQLAKRYLQDVLQMSY